jgi:hypothetical protein
MFPARPEMECNLIPVRRADQEKLKALNCLLAELEDAAMDSCEEGEEIQLTLLLSPLVTKE